jgi:16S rRNA (guanine527-N7)-methyltransferase
MAEDGETLRCGAAALGLELHEEQIRLLLAYLDLLYTANEYMNLTRVPRSEAIPRHVLESLSVVPELALATSARVLDLGTGGGLPGVPIAIVKPEWRVTLLDARRKKVEFLNGVVEDLGLKSVETVHGRAEDCARSVPMRRAFDAVVARAVAPLERLVVWMEPFLKPSGMAAAMRSGAGAEEAVAVGPALRNCGLSIRDIRDVRAPEVDAARTLVILERVRRSELGSRKAR